MVETIDNGRVLNWKPSTDKHGANPKIYGDMSDIDDEFCQFEEEINPNNLKYKCSVFEQFTILFRRASKQIYRNKVN